MKANFSPTPRAVSYGPNCPRCDSSTNRIPRRFIDLLLSIFIPLRRYRCRAMRCNWEGNLRYPTVASPPGGRGGATPS